MFYRDLIKKYNFEELNAIELAEINPGFEGYTAIYQKETKTAEYVMLAIPKDNSGIEISWSASGIDFAPDIDDAPASGWLVNDSIGLEFLRILQEALHITHEFHR
jgi:hypothetical protein